MDFFCSYVTWNYDYAMPVMQLACLVVPCNRVNDEIDTNGVVLHLSQYMMYPYISSQIKFRSI
jgi:hypothetical protein